MAGHQGRQQPATAVPCVRTFVPLKAMCSRKCAAPLLAAVSKRLPASIHTPTTAVSAKGVVSDATRSPLGSVVTCVCYDSSACITLRVHASRSKHCAFTHGRQCSGLNIQ